MFKIYNYVNVVFLEFCRNTINFNFLCEYEMCKNWPNNLFATQAMYEKEFHSLVFASWALKCSFRNGLFDCSSRDRSPETTNGLAFSISHLIVVSASRSSNLGVGRGVGFWTSTTKNQKELEKRQCLRGLNNRFHHY